MWRRIWHFVVDLADGILGGMLYGHQGGFGWYSTSAEIQNANKLRRWAASGKAAAREQPGQRARVERPEDFDARMRRFRRDGANPRQN